MSKSKTNKNRKIIEIALITVATFSFSAHVFASSITSENLERLINKERTERGIPKLKVNADLNQASNLKAKDMVNRNYFEHYALGLTPWDFIKLGGYDYLYAGENLAMDFNTSEGMVNAWMHSPAHRDNILNPDFNDMGIGIVKGEFTEKGVTRPTSMVVNMFGRKKPSIIKAFEYVTKNIFRFF